MALSVAIKAVFFGLTFKPRSQLVVPLETLCCLPGRSPRHQPSWTGVWQGVVVSMELGDRFGQKWSLGTTCRYSMFNMEEGPGAEGGSPA